jgi:hypothetical protein
MGVVMGGPLCGIGSFARRVDLDSRESPISRVRVATRRETLDMNTGATLSQTTLDLALTGARLEGAGTLRDLVREPVLLAFLRHGG